VLLFTLPRQRGIATRVFAGAMAAEGVKFKPPSWASQPQHKCWLERRRAGESADSVPVDTVRLDERPHTTFGHAREAVDVYVDDRCAGTGLER
jgi:hypothetical protein